MLCIVDRSPDPKPETVAFRLDLPADETAVAAALDHIGAALSDLGISPALCGDVAITLGEVLNNVIEHACAGRDQAAVTVQGGTTGAELWIEVCDPGLPFEDGLLPQGLAADVALPVEDLPEGGFGWFLIRSLTTGVDYRREGERNHLVLRFAL